MGERVWMEEGPVTKTNLYALMFVFGYYMYDIAIRRQRGTQIKVRNAESEEGEMAP